MSKEFRFVYLYAYLGLGLLLRGGIGESINILYVDYHDLQCLECIVQIYTICFDVSISMATSLSK